MAAVTIRVTANRSAKRVMAPLGGRPLGLRSAAMVALALGLLAGSAQAKGDRVVFVDGAKPDLVGVEVVKETLAEVRLRRKGTLRGKEILRIVHGSPPASYAKGEAAFLSGQYKTATAAFQAAQSAGGQEWVGPYAVFYEAESLRLGGEVSADKARFDEAASRYRKFLETYPDHLLTAAAKAGLGEALLAAGDADAARKKFEEVAQRKYGDYWELAGKVGIGLCAMAQKQYLEALTQFQSTIAAAKRPGFSEVLVRAQVAKGATYMAKRDFDQAISFYERLASRGEGQGAQAAAGAYVNLARAYQERGRGDDKKKALRTYMAVTIYYAGAPKAYADALYHTGKLLEELGDKKRAEPFFRELKARCSESNWAQNAP